MSCADLHSHKICCDRALRSYLFLGLAIAKTNAARPLKAAARCRMLLACPLVIAIGRCCFHSPHQLSTRWPHYYTRVQSCTNIARLVQYRARYNNLDNNSRPADEA